MTEDQKKDKAELRDLIKKARDIAKSINSEGNNSPLKMVC